MIEKIMIQQLYLRYLNFLKLEITESNSCKENQARLMILNYNFAQKGLKILISFWLLYQLYNYYLMTLRPIELYQPMNFFQQLFQPTFPSITVVFFVVLMTLFLCFYKKHKYDILGNILLTFCIMWLNALRWNYGFFSHVGHIFILAHLFFVFIPQTNKSENDQNIFMISKMIKWAYFAILVTYTFSGIWKIIGLFFRLLFKPTEINWLSSDAVLNQVMIGYVDWDISFPEYINAFTIPIVWQCSFIMMVLLQLGSFLGAFRRPLLTWIMWGNIAFHLINTIFFKIEFWLTPITLLILFFPYHIFFHELTNHYKIKWNGAYNQASYTRHYDVDKDVYTGFYAYRAKFEDAKKWWVGLLFIPFVSMFCTFLWKKKK